MKNHSVKKYLRLAAALLAALSFAVFAMSAAGGGRSALRLHVIANSDSAEDQRVKLIVRDAVLACMSEAPEPETQEEARERLLLKGGELQEAAERALAEEGADYPVQLIAGEFDFPEKEYAGRVYPAGRYEALRIVLGEGEGQNWWCVMFPPLCIPDSGGGIEKNPDGTLKFRSLFYDLWRGIFG